jgi:hypothetical protein
VGQPEARTLEMRRLTFRGRGPGKSRHRLCGARAHGYAAALPGGVGAPPGWVLRPACEELADSEANASCKARPDAELSSPGRRWRSPQMSPESESLSGGAPSGATGSQATADACTEKDWLRRAARHPPRSPERGKNIKTRMRKPREDNGHCPHLRARAERTAPTFPPRRKASTIAMQAHRITRTPASRA